jgi:hypothetical protein
MLMRQLDAMGFDCRALIKNVVALMSGSGSGEEGEGSEVAPVDPQMIVMLALAKLQESGISEQELMEMSEDSGIDIQKLIIDLIVYLSEQSEEPVVDEPTEEPVVEQGGEEVLEAPAKRAARLVKALDKSANPVVNYELQLREWLGDYLKK